MTRVFTPDEIDKGLHYQLLRDDAYYRQFYRWAEEHLVTGKPAFRGELTYRGDGYVIYEGTIHTIERVTFDRHGGYRRNPHGDSICWGASFPDPLDPKRWQPKIYHQTSDGHEFHCTRESAIRDLVYKAKRHLEEKTRESIEAEQLVKRLENLR